MSISSNIQISMCSENNEKNLTAKQREVYIYNKQYYAKNKESITAKLYKKVECDVCQRIVRHQQLSKHKKTKICLKVNNNMQTILKTLLQQIDKLQSIQQH